MKKKILLLSTAIALIAFCKIDFAQSFFGKHNIAQRSFFNSSFATKEDLVSRKKWEFNRLKDPYTNLIPNNIFFAEREFAKTLPNDRTVQLCKGNKLFSTDKWIYRGPFNQGGRSRAVAVDINNPNIILAGGTTGGMWRSTDKGISWKKVTHANDTIQTVTCVVQDTREGKTNTWYYGTGEYSSNLELHDNGAGFTAFIGSGIYKSTDNGETWNRLASTSPGYSPTFNHPFQIIWNIALDTTVSDQDIVFAALIGGIYRSEDGGATWEAVLGGGDNRSIYSSVVAASNGEVYAALSNGVKQGIWHSANGTDWTDITPAEFPEVYTRIVIADAPSNPELLYILANTPGSGKPGSTELGMEDYHNLWKYDSEANEWTNLSDNLPDQSGEVGGYSSQIGYDQLIKVSPDNPDLVIIGGTNLYRTTDGFSTLVDSTGWIGGYSPLNDVSSYPNQHADEHDLIFLPSDPKVVYSAHDGGISYTQDITANPVEWTSLNNGFSTTQFYSVALDHATQNSPLIVGGMQDNGNMMDSIGGESSNWIVLPYGGDGCISAVANGGEYIYFSTQNGNIMEGRLADQQGALIVPEGAYGFMFVTPYVLDPTNNRIIFVAAGNHIWRNSDVLSIPIGTDTTTSINWTDMTNIDIGSNVSALEVSCQPEHILYYGTSNGKLHKVINAHQGNPSSTDITGNDFPTGYITSIAIDPKDANNVLVGFSNYNVMSIFCTTDGGTTWEAVSGNLEQNSDGTGNGPSIRSIKILSVDGNKIYFVGTSTGLYAAAELNGMSTNWIQQGSENIGMIVAESIDSRDIDGTVIVGTFGNGVYGTKIFATGIKEENNSPAKFALDQNYPNPFNPTTVISWQLPATSQVTLKIYDVLGKEITSVVNEMQEAGIHKVNWNAQNSASGIYFYELTAKSSEGRLMQIRKKMMVLK